MLKFNMIGLLLLMVLPWKVTKAANDSSSVPQTEATGLARLKEVLDQRAMEAEFRQKPHYEDASTNPANHKDKVRYASGLWLSRNHEMQQPQHRHPQQPQLQQSRHESSVSSFKQRSKRNSPEYSPWKRRKIHHESSSVVKKSELHHHSTTAHWPQAAASSSSQTASEAADPMMATLTAAGRDMAVNMMKKRKPGLAGRMYDVPQIECPRSEDRMERFACPSPDFRGRYRCIDDRSLCDGFFDCPAREDENPDMCLFYKTTKAHLDILAEALLRWARGR